MGHPPTSPASGCSSTTHRSPTAGRDTPGKPEPPPACPPCRAPAARRSAQRGPVALPPAPPTLHAPRHPRQTPTRGPGRSPPTRFCCTDTMSKKTAVPQTTTQHKDDRHLARPTPRQTTTPRDPQAENHHQPHQEPSPPTKQPAPTNRTPKSHGGSPCKSSPSWDFQTRPFGSEKRPKGGRRRGTGTGGWPPCADRISRR